ncbi:MAG: FAD-dependent oxidoreductase [Leptolyngbyaceae cyanobacterium SM2_5_2]|nr:FAD-dependent oxidoreductase [Leptolyngbyaceae cyanobacterium SM2_5_2]
MGAGIAGLAAARTLIDSGQEVKLLEARNPPGGRIWTDLAWAKPPSAMTTLRQMFSPTIPEPTAYA